ncbi:MAG TPA: DUF4126 domain-containing protein [Candidatus Acidoferrales bacterium]|jgi:hypothetical protein|nr:DUF4126 domain-containing protein [Candidatus Acidoferrales bacterium]
METIELLGSTMGLGFIAGIRLYATVLALGLAIQFDLLHLGPSTEQLRVLAHPAVIVASGIACLAEFLVDKIPWVDSVWDSFHTFIRPIGAAVLAATVLGTVDPVLKLTLVILCGSVAFASHSSKAASRLVVNHSPEPFTNIGISLAEDVVALFGVWLSLRHPLFALSLVLMFLAGFVLVGPRVFRSIRLQIVALRALLMRKRIANANRTSRQQAIQTSNSQLASFLGIIAIHASAIPERHARCISKSSSGDTPAVGIRVAATKSIKGLRNSIGYLIIEGDDLAFVARRRFRHRVHRIKLPEVVDAEWKPGLLMNRFILRTSTSDHAFYVFKDIDIHSAAAARLSTIETQPRRIPVDSV